MKLAEKVLEKQPYAFAYGLLIGSASGAVASAFAASIVLVAK